MIKLNKRIKAVVKFDKSIAKKSMDMGYYKTQSENMKGYQYIQSEKLRLSTRRWGRVTKILDEYKYRGETEISTTGKILNGIYEKNKKIALGESPFKKTTNIISVIARVETLLLAYKRIRKNKGAMTKAGNVNAETLNTYNQQQRELYYRTKIFPDGFSIRDLEIARYLILKGEYPWGTSRRIWIDKPGDPSKKRPITIPPFMDRVVQEAIKMVLYSIWEPDFELLNRSFGFRPNKSCHDAIVALKSNYAQGLFRAVEGDIESAYDSVDKNVLLSQLRRKIQDNTFMKLMAHRLRYEYVDEENNTRIRPILGIPQGGIDSPYLFNIYLHDLDVYVNTEIKAFLDNLNEKRKLKAFLPKGRVYEAIRKEKRLIKTIKTRLKIEIPDFRNLMTRIKNIKRLRHKHHKMPFYDPTTLELRLFYVRYADDWILLCNGDKNIAEKIKQDISSFLSNNLKAKLSEKKTVISDIRYETAHFLGFEFSRPVKGRLYKLNGIIKRAPTATVVNPDRQRLINRLYMKGFCDANGVPKEIPWLSCFEPHVIIQRYNATMAGFMQYYAEWVNNKTSMRRWVYIMTFSCLKTLARKYKTTISKIYRKYGINLHTPSDKTIAFVAKLRNRKKIYEKTWALHTYKELLFRCNSQGRLKSLSKAFYDKEKNKTIGDYKENTSKPNVTNEDFLEAITWTSFRTQASFDLPCCICGSTTDLNMHHIRHVRLTPYKNIEQRTYLQVMALRNRRQIPLCRDCHMNYVHSGKYNGTALRKLIDMKVLTDNLIVNSESIVKKGPEYNAKSLEEKGWVEKIN